MNVEEFLHRTREPYAIFTRETCLAEFRYLFTIFDDLFYHFDFKPEDPPLELILTQSSIGYATQIIRKLDRPCIVLELHDMHLASQVMEAFAFDDILGSGLMSQLQALWINSPDKYEHVADPAFRNGWPGTISFSGTRSMQLGSDLLLQFFSPVLTGPVCRLEGFKRIFEVVPTFFLAHEMAHFVYPTVGRDLKSKTFKIIAELLHERLNERFSGLIKLPNVKSYSPFLTEEVVCDIISGGAAYDVCSGDHWIDARLFCIMQTIMFGPLLVLLMLRGRSSKDDLDAFSTRKGYVLMQAVSGLVSDAKLSGRYDVWLAYFVQYLALLNDFCSSLAIALFKSSGAGLSEECEEALQGFAVYDASNPATNKLIAVEMQKMARVFCADRSII